MLKAGRLEFATDVIVIGIVSSAPLSSAMRLAVDELVEYAVFVRT